MSHRLSPSGLFFVSEYLNVADPGYSAATTNTPAENRAAIQRAIDRAYDAGGGVVLVPPIGTFNIDQSLIWRSNVSLKGGGARSIIRMPAASFNNIFVGTANATSVAISCLGELSGAFAPLTNVTFEDFVIESEVSDGRYLLGILARNVENVVIRRVEMFGFAAGSPIKLDSIGKASSVEYCYIHDCTTAVAYSSTPQITGIEIDSDRVNGVASEKLDLHDNHIENLTFTGTALSTYGFQTDGINIGVSTKCRIHDNHIENVGEGIDVFATECNVHSNELVDCYSSGIKLIHGASRNNVYGNSIIRPGLAGFHVGSSDSVGNVEDNYIYGNQIHDVNPTNAWDVGVYATAAIRLDVNAGHTYKPANNTFARNKVTGGGTNMRYIIRCDEGGTGNRFYDNEGDAFATAYSSVASGSAIITNAKKALVRVGLSATQSTATGVPEVVEYADEEIDTQSEFNTTTHVYTANSPRRLNVKAAIFNVSGGAGEAWDLQIRKNGSARAAAQVWTGGSGDTFTVEDVFSVEIGDTIDILVQQSSGAGRDIGGSSVRNFLTIEEVAS